MPPQWRLEPISRKKKRRRIDIRRRFFEWQTRRESSPGFRAVRQMNNIKATNRKAAPTNTAFND